MQNHPSHIAVIHQNSLCCLAMRTILNDIMPFMGAMGCVEIVSFNNIEEITEKYRNKIFLYFVSGDIVCENLQFFSQIARRCIVLNEGEDFIYKEFKHINTLLPEHELIKNLLMIHNHTHHSHSPHLPHAGIKFVSSVTSVTSYLLLCNNPKRCLNISIHYDSS